VSLSRELIVAAKARADAATEAFNSKRLGMTVVAEEDLTYHFDGGGARTLLDFVETAAREDVPVMADALLRVLDIHRREMFGGDAVCSSCLRNTSPMPGRVSWPCATVRAVTGDGSSSNTERSEQ
jgi:hypothetical protein